MRRLATFVVRNWPLKVAAIIFATLLYAGLVLSQNARVFPGSVPIIVLNQPTDAVLITELEDVREISYFAPDDLAFRPSTSSFRATVDLANVDPAAGPTTVDVQVESIIPGIQVLGYQPTRITVQLERFVTREVPVDVQYGTVPAGLEIRPPEYSPDRVQVSGPESVVRLVVVARANVRIDPSGLDVDREVPLIPVDLLGEPLTPVDVTPGTTRVRIAVFRDLESRPLPVNPLISGTPAPGFEIASVSVDPLVVTVEGDADQLTDLSRVDTVPISIAGATSDLTQLAGLSLPAGILPLGISEVRVTITLRPITATRTFSSGVELLGVRPDLVYELSTRQILATIGGSTADLDRLEGRTFTVLADVTGLEEGEHDVAITVNLPAGLALVSSSPATIRVTVTLAALPNPTASPAPSP
jgi:YbbR domain-containing protein